MTDERGTHQVGPLPGTGGGQAADDGKKRVALVIGNADYRYGGALANPRRDAETLAGAFKTLGFHKVLMHEDLELRTLTRALTDFRLIADDADTAVVYFAGHGIEIDGLNRLIPVDAELDHVIRVPDETIGLNRVQFAVQGARNLRLVILDACRDNPFIERMRGLSASRSAGAHSRVPLEQEPTRSIGQGLAAPRSISGMLVAYAADAGQKAMDGPDNSNSPFASALVATLNAEPHLDVRFLFGKVRDEVFRRTSGNQEPAIYGQLGGGTYALCPAPSMEPQPSPDPVPPPQDADDRLWARIDGADQIEDYRFYLDEFPTGRHAQLARLAISQLERAAISSDIQLQLAHRTEYWKTKDDGTELRRIFVWLVGATQGLDQVDKVVYTLHSTFRNPIREVTDRGNGFQLRTNGWGAFEIKAVAHFSNGRTPIELTRNITFDPLPNAHGLVPSADNSSAQFASTEDQVNPNHTIQHQPSVTATGNILNNPTATVNQAPLRESIDAPRTYDVIVGDASDSKTVQLAPGESIQDAPYAPEMVLVPPGTFRMGSPEGQGHANERPQHEVSISYPFLVGKYPVTFDEWDAFAQDGGIIERTEKKSGIIFTKTEGSISKYTPDDAGFGHGRRPVINVSWHDANAYATWLSEQTGQSYRLLSEAEWEYSCRAGTNTMYSFGDDAEALDKYAWFDDNSDWKTRPVGEKLANAFGLHDMHGNVWEWCVDAWHDNYDNAPSDGRPREDVVSSETVSRVLRGGSWGNDPVILRSAIRDIGRPDVRGDSVGFRLARTLNP